MGKWLEPCAKAGGQPPAEPRRYLPLNMSPEEHESLRPHALIKRRGWRTQRRGAMSKQLADGLALRDDPHRPIFAIVHGRLGIDAQRMIYRRQQVAWSDRAVAGFAAV